MKYLIFISTSVTLILITTLYYLQSNHFFPGSVLAANPTATPTPVPYYFGNDPVTGDFIIGQRGGNIKIRVDSTGALIAPLKFTPNGQNLILNGGFEQNVRNDSANPDNWMVNYQQACASCTYALATNTTYVTAGSKVLSMTTTNNTQVASIGSDAFPVAAGKTYTLTLDAAGAFTGLTAKVVFFSASGNTSYSDSDQTDTATVINGITPIGSMSTYPTTATAQDFTVPSTCGVSNNLPCTRASLVIIQTGAAGTNVRYIDNVSILLKGTGGTVNASYVSSGQFGSQTGGGIYTFNGNVGIGTSTPSQALDINGIINATNFYQSGSPFISSQWSSGTGLIYYNGGNVGIGTTIPSAKLTIGGSSSTISNGSGNITILPSVNLVVGQGNMGIGTTVPQAKLDVAGTGSSISNASGDLALLPVGNIGIGTTAAAQKLDIAAASANLLFSSSTGPHQILSGGTSDIAIIAGGNVGINTTAPASELDINGQFGSKIFNAGNSGTSKTLDWNNGNTQYLTLTGNVGTLTLSNPVSGRKYTLILKQDATGSRVVTWPSAMRWSGGTTPTLTTTANKADYIGFVYNDIDSKYDGVAIVKNF